MRSEEIKERQKWWAETSPEYRDEVAREIAKTITIRSYVDGTSYDDERPTTKPEAEIIYNICRAAISTFGYRLHSNDADDVLNGLLDTAEFAMHYFLPEANAYDTVYCPLMKAFTHGKEN